MHAAYAAYLGLSLVVPHVYWLYTSEACHAGELMDLESVTAAAHHLTACTARLTPGMLRDRVMPAS